MRRPWAAAAVAAALFAGPARAQEVPPADGSELLDVLLSGLLGFEEVTGDELQKEVADLGEVAFRRPVPLEYLDRKQLSAYLDELLQEEYPPDRAEADQRTLAAFGLLEPGTDLRGLRRRLLEENIIGFYDERPGRRRLYAVSGSQRLTPANQLILAHELRHALQDQYLDVHALLDEGVGDFDDRRLALLSLLEGDATFLMERFLLRRVPGGETLDGEDLQDLSMPAPTLEGAPAVLRDQMVLPYMEGLQLVRTLWRNGGWQAVRSAWDRRPRSTEQVLHPAKYIADEAPLPVQVGTVKVAGRVINEGVLGEMLAGTLLGEAAGRERATGWGGDAFRVWDLAGRTLLVWRAAWDTEADAARFAEALRGRLSSAGRAADGTGSFTRFARGEWTFALARRGAETILASSDDRGAVESALPSLGR
jgi:hypothetical protein